MSDGEPRLPPTEPNRPDGDSEGWTELLRSQGGDILPAGVDSADPRIRGFLAAYYSGMFPPPSMLRDWDAVVPGLAQTIAESIKKQSDHRQEMESAVIKGGLLHERMGVLIGGSITITSIIMGGLTVINGYPIAGTSIATACVVAIAGVFVYGTDSRRRERQAKATIQKDVEAKTAPKIGSQQKRQQSRKKP